MRDDELLPKAPERRAILDDLARQLNGLWDTLPERPIGPVLDAAARRCWLESYTFEKPRPLRELTRDVASAVADGTLLSQHPRCFGLFNPTPAFPGVLADLITAAINPQLAATSHAPIAVEIEAHVIQAVGRRIWVEGVVDGHFTSGGAEANMTAALLALTSAEPGFAVSGARAFPGAPMLYASAESHFAWFKIAHQLGIGRVAVRLVPTDGHGRMSAAVLAAAIAEDRAAGAVPVLVIATAGTTNAGMIDPLDACAEIARREGLWYHVDAAWGGALLASPARREALAGLASADSVTIDAHKFFSVPMGAGMLLTRRSEMLGEAFRVSANYMPASDEASDPYLRSAQWSRRFMGLKLFMTLATIGWTGYGDAIDRQLRLADVLSNALRRHGFRIENASPVGVQCFTHPRVDAGTIVEAVQNSGRAWISAAAFEGRAVIRACVTSFRATEADVELLVAELAKAVDAHLATPMPA